MANRTFVPDSYTLIKRRVELYAAVACTGESGTAAISLRTWNYPVFGAGPDARTYTAAPTTAAGAGYPTQYRLGAEGIKSVARTGTGAWTLTLQDAYQRCLGVSFTTEDSAGVSTVVSVAKFPDTTGSLMATNDGSVIKLVFSSSTGTAADPADGDLILLTIILADATEP